MGLLESQLEQFDAKGYIVLPKFFGTEYINIFKNDYEKAIKEKNVNSPIIDVSLGLKDTIRKKVQPVMDIMHLKTDLKAMDIIRGAAYFPTERDINFPWHQDSKSYYLLQDAYNYLNLYIPIIKPEANKSNLKIVPFDILKKQAPHIYEKLHKRGSTGVVVNQDKGTQFIDNINDSLLDYTDQDINNLAYTPHLEAGDLLMMRGDVLHCTQDTETNRVALSIRLIHSSSMVQKKKLVECGVYKLRMLLKNSELFLTLLNCFEESGRDELSSLEVMDYLSRHGFSGFRE